MKRYSTLLALLGLLMAGLVGLGTSPAYAADKDCSDFGTQKAAQDYFLSMGGPQVDPDQLDSDGDGIACETLPCPCSTATGGGGDSTGTIRQRGKVTKVVDGDTIKVRLASGGRRTVRMVGIDTPEVYGDTECGGAKASRSLRQLLPVGQRVRLVSDPSQANKDRYGRILRYVMKPNGVDTNRRQVYRGWAKVYVFNNNPFQRVKGYRAAQADAKAAPRGIWRIC